MSLTLVQGFLPAASLPPAEMSNFKAKGIQPLVKVSPSKHNSKTLRS